MSDKKAFNILSIDGGGIKGLYPARVLEQIELRFNKKISDHFDLICGTSTGGLIALALSLGYDAKTIAGFYTQKGEIIFPPKSKWRDFLSTLKQGFIGNKYKSDRLQEELTDFLALKRKLKIVKHYSAFPHIIFLRGNQ